MPEDFGTLCMSVEKLCFKGLVFKLHHERQGLLLIFVDIKEPCNVGMFKRKVYHRLLRKFVSDDL